MQLKRCHPTWHCRLCELVAANIAAWDINPPKRVVAHHASLRVGPNLEVVVPRRELYGVEDGTPIDDPEGAHVDSVHAEGGRVAIRVHLHAYGCALAGRKANLGVLESA